MPPHFWIVVHSRWSQVDKWELPSEPEIGNSECKIMPSVSQELEGMSKERAKLTGSEVPVESLSSMSREAVERVSNQDDGT